MIVGLAPSGRTIGGATEMTGAITSIGGEGVGRGEAAVIGGSGAIAGGSGGGVANVNMAGADGAGNGGVAVITASGGAVGLARVLSPVREISAQVWTNTVLLCQPCLLIRGVDATMAFPNSDDEETKR